MKTDQPRPGDFQISDHPYTEDWDAFHDGACGWRHGVWHGDIHYCGAPADHHASREPNVAERSLELWREQAYTLRQQGLGQHVQINLESIDMIIGYAADMRRRAQLVAERDIRPIRIEIPQDHALAKVEILRRRIMMERDVSLDATRTADWVLDQIDDLFGKVTHG